MAIVYILHIETNYKEEAKRFVFFHLDKAQGHMRKLWQDAQNAWEYDPQPFGVSVRYSDNVISAETYFEDDNALVTWREHIFHQWVRLSIVEGELLEEGGRV